MGYQILRFLFHLLSLRSFVELVYVEVSMEGLQTNIFSSPQAMSYKSIRLIDDVVYIGGNGTLFLQNADNISSAISESIQWAVTDEQYRACLTLPQGRTPENCANFISVIQPYNSTHVLLCGTMALKPTDTFFNTKEKRIEKSNSVLQEPLCSFDPSDAVTSILATEGGAFSGIAATSRDIGAKMTLIKTLQDSSFLRTSQDDRNMIGEDSTFIGSFSAEDPTQHDAKKLYFVFGENSLDPSTNGYDSRIAQVCANDMGGDGKFAGKWTSFLKTELVCQSNEKSPTKFNVVTGMKMTDDGILYGTFKTQSDQFRLSAVCSFKLSDIQRAFNSNDFLGSEFEVVEKPEGIDRPGMCSYSGLDGNPTASSKNFPAEFLNFITKHPVVTSLTPSYPLYTDKDETFEKVDIQQVTSLHGISYDVLFIAMSNGNVRKYVSSTQTGFKRELASFAMASKITGIDVNPSKDQLYVETDQNIIQVSTSSCSVYTRSCDECEPCRMCVLSRDPMCAWEINNEVCTSISDMRKTTNLIQDVESGKIDRCNVLNETSDQVLVSYGSSVVLGNPLHSNTVSTRWSRKLSGDNFQPIQDSQKYFITRNGRLEINHFSESDEGIYACERIVSNVIVARTLFDVDNSPLSTLPPVPSSKPGDGGSVVTSKTTITDPLSPSTATPSFTLFPEPNEGGISGGTIAMIIIILLFVIAGLCVGYWFYRRRSSENLYDTGETKYQKGVVTTDAVTFGPESNNSNNKVIGAELMSVSLIDADDRKDDYIYNQEMKARVSPLTATPRQVAAVKPLLKDHATSSDTLPYIDDPENSTLPSPRSRKTPQRSKSIPASNILVQLGKGQSFRCKAARKSVAGTWVLEVDIADYEIINGTPPKQNGMDGSFGSVNDVGKDTPTSQHSEASGLLTDEVLQAFDSKFLPRQEQLDTDSDSTVKAFPSGGNRTNVETNNSLPSQQTQPTSSYRLNNTPPPVAVRDKSTRNEKSPRSTTSTDSNSSSADKFHTAPPSPLKISNPAAL